MQGIVNCPPNCGLCCMRCNLLPELMAYDRGDGVCVFLSEDRQCQIYERRPMVCDARAVRDAWMPEMSDEELLDASLSYCRKLGADV